jgi:hypothetical protein
MKHLQVQQFCFFEMPCIIFSYDTQQAPVGYPSCVMGVYFLITKVESIFTHDKWP